MSTVTLSARRAAVVQTWTGIGLASLILLAWLGCHIYGVFVHRWTPVGFAVAPLLVALQCWLNVGLFIVAHDCMHGSLAPHRPMVNLALGRACLLLYAGFSYDRLITKHFDHHRHSGTALDPDYNDENPEHFWQWYATFFLRYFGWRPFLINAGVAIIYAEVLGADLANIAVLWILPAILSSFQLFYFGTYRPHRLEDDVFPDHHKARSSGYPWLTSLLTCFHFGHHHEHHLAPHVPWWKLPQQRAP